MSPLTGWRGTPSERLDAKCVRGEGDCVLWMGTSDFNGYGAIQIGGTMVKVHRFAYERAKGAIPPGLEIDHLCRVRNCVNPDHLEAVTRAENNRRAAATKTGCKHGHEYTPENTYLNSRGDRECRTCTVARKCRRREERSAA